MLEYGSAEWLDELRTMLVLGWLGLAIVAFLDWTDLIEEKFPKREAPKPPRDGFCPLHRSDPADCQDKH